MCKCQEFAAKKQCALCKMAYGVDEHVFIVKTSYQTSSFVLGIWKSTQSHGDVILPHKMHTVICDQQARAYWTSSNCKIRSFQPFREQGMYTQHFSSRMVPINKQQMLSWTSCTTCLITMSCQINFQSTMGVGGPGHHVHWTWSPVLISSGGYLKNYVYNTNPHSILELQAQIGIIAEEIRDDMLHDTYDKFVIGLQKVHKVKGSHWTRVYKKTTCTQTPWKSPFIHESYVSVVLSNITNNTACHVCCMLFSAPCGGGGTQYWRTMKLRKVHKIKQILYEMPF